MSFVLWNYVKVTKIIMRSDKKGRRNLLMLTQKHVTLMEPML